MTQEDKELKFCECKTLEEFKERYKIFHVQNFLLHDGLSLFDVKTSNMDGTIIGEQFDHPLRMKCLYENNEKFFNDINEDELMNEVNEMYKELIDNFINKYGEELLKHEKETFGKYYIPYKNDTRREKIIVERPQCEVDLRCNS